MSHILLSAKNIGFELPHKTLFKGLSFSVAEGDRIGLVGRNGEGKSTILKILARELEPSAGTLGGRCRIYYLPQIDTSLFESEMAISAFLETRNLAWPLAKASLHRLFQIDWISAERQMRTLSGGELAKLLIAISAAKDPDILLLDEPTNHLDIEGLEVLKQFLLSFEGAFITVSHDPLFLDHVVNFVWELEEGKISTFGGNYSYYREQKRLADEARMHDLKAVKKSIKKIHNAIDAQETRSIRAEREGRRSKSATSRDKFAEGFFKHFSEMKAGSVNKRLEHSLNKYREQEAVLDRPRRKTAHPDLLTGGDVSKRSLIRVSEGALYVGGKKFIDDINLRVTLGDRIVFTGRNGSGKSSLAMSLVKESSEYYLRGKVRKSETFNAVYMDQKYQIIKPNLSLLENLLLDNPQLSNEESRKQLGRFLFAEERDVKKKAGVLSGGETARLLLAMITARPIDLLVLDEPTNNLDIDTLDIISDALADFKGALIVISHNIYFLARLKISQAFCLKDGSLKPMKRLPSKQEEFYSELKNLMTKKP